MVKTIVAAAGLLLLFAAFSLSTNVARAVTDPGDAIVIVYKDGHSQTIPASDIAQLNLKSASGTTTPITIPGAPVPGRRRFVGKWQVGVGGGYFAEVAGSFTIVLDGNGNAKKSIGEAHGTWTYSDGEARISWDDGWHDAIRKVGNKYKKFAYAPGKSFADSPSNTTDAQNTDPQPI
jgi:hypothetical protein